MYTLISNLVRQTRNEKLNGKDFIVAPVTLIVEGVLNGSNGPLFYPLDEIAKCVSQWNGVPLVINHPYENGNPISARAPAVLDASGVGSVFNVKLDGQKLRGEAWFCMASLRRLNPGILRRLQNNEQIEISTGLSGKADPAESNATFNGASYTAIVRDYQPDHLAVLPTASGACSINDGCGINNETKDKGGTSMPKSEADRKTAIDGLIANCCCWAETDRVQLNELGDSVLDTMTEQAKADAEQVTVANAAKQGFTDPGGSKHTFNETTQEWETIVNEVKLEPTPTVEPVVVPVVVPVVNEEPKPLTDEEWLANAPAGIREAVVNASEITAKAKAELVDLLTANVEDDKKAAAVEMLANKSLDELKTLVTLLPADKQTSQLANTIDYLGRTGPAPFTNQDLGEAIKSPSLFK